MIVDTDVMIWYFRGNEKAAKILSSFQHFSISAVVYMELLQGVRNKNELRIIKHLLANEIIETISITPEITSRASFFLEKYALSHGLKMADALIAATADIYGQEILTGNDSHYKMISSLSIKKFRP